MLIKVKFIKSGKPYGRAYTYKAPGDTEVGDIANVNGSKAIVTEINVPEEEVVSFKDKLKSISGPKKKKDNNEEKSM